MSVAMVGRMRTILLLLLLFGARARGALCYKADESADESKK
jgi:hypothetical protein